MVDPLATNISTSCWYQFQLCNLRYGRISTPLPPWTVVSTILLVSTSLLTHEGADKLQSPSSTRVRHMSTFIQDNAISTIIKMIDDEITKDTLNLHSPTMFLHMERFYVMENKNQYPVWRQNHNSRGEGFMLRTKVSYWTKTFTPRLEILSSRNLHTIY